MAGNDDGARFFDLSGKHALVTGATGPLARALAVALADADGKPVGQLTSSKRSFALEKVIGLGYVKTASASVGASLQATCGDRRVEATVTDLPFVPGTAS